MLFWNIILWALHKLSLKSQSNVGHETDVKGGLVGRLTINKQCVLQNFVVYALTLTCCVYINSSLEFLTNLAAI